jgi:hypothetical protein
MDPVYSNATQEEDLQELTEWFRQERDLRVLMSAQLRVNNLASKEGRLTEDPYEEVRYVALMGRYRELEEKIAAGFQTHRIWWSAFAGIAGFPPLCAAYMTFHIRDVGRFDSLSALRTYSGISRGEWHPRVRSSVWLAAKELIKTNPDWKMRYENRVKLEDSKLASTDSVGRPSSLAEHRALWWTMGKIIKHIWLTWPRTAS